MSDRPVTLLVVADGLRPAAIDPDVMPYLAALGDTGCQYTNAVAVFPAVTRANAATLVTGCLPGHHGVFGNRVWHAETGALDTADRAHVRRLLAAGAIPQPSVVERFSRAGLSTVVVGNGSAGCTYLLNPGTDNGHGAMITSVGAQGTPFSSLPATAQHAFDRLGPRPVTADGSLAWATTAATTTIEALSPDLLVFWSGEPDTVHHHTGPSSDSSREVLRRVDDTVRDLHHAAHATGRPCNLIVTADHGFCESTESPDLGDDLDAAVAVAGIDRGDMVATFNSGVVLIYLRGNVPPRERARLAEHLAKQFWAGPVLCTDDHCPDGVFPASWATGGASEFAPDIFVTMRTSATDPAASVDTGAPARAVHARPPGTAPYKGVHGSLHPEDMRIPLILHGPAFACGSIQSAPAGIVDIAPTIHQLVLDRPLPGADGRVLTEALREPDGDPASASPCDVLVRERGGHQLAFRDTGRHQYLLGGAATTTTGGQ